MKDITLKKQIKEKKKMGIIKLKKKNEDVEMAGKQQEQLVVGTVGRPCNFVGRRNEKG